jgi:hypothetical protein
VKASVRRATVTRIEDHSEGPRNRCVEITLQLRNVPPDLMRVLHGMKDSGLIVDAAIVQASLFPEK